MGKGVEEENTVKVKGQWAYTRAGKWVRGILCMLTFMLFMLFLGLAGYVFEEFGARILTDKDYDFYSSSKLLNKIGDEAAEIAGCVRDVEKNSSRQEFQIIDAGKGVINSYDIEVMRRNGIDYIDNTMDIKDYVTSGKDLLGSVYDYEYISDYIEKLSGDSSCYLYFDSEAFIRIFTQNGIKNTDLRFSDKFSESAYFIYMDSDVMKALNGTKKNNGTKDDNSGYLKINGDEGSSINYDLDISDDASAINIILNAEGLPNLSTLKYAVYDPETNVFYSTWDDYFSPYDYYMYDVDEVKSEIDSHSDIGEDVGSIIFPLLWSRNLSDVWEDVSASYVDTEEASRELEIRQDSAFVYYIEIGGENKTIYSNVNSAQEIVEFKNDISYVEWGDDYDGGIAYDAWGDNEDEISHPKPFDELHGAEYIKTKLNELSTDHVMYFGIDRSKLSPADHSLSASYLLGYEAVGEYIRYIIAGAVICFVLLIIQAAYLIMTTGRESREDKLAGKVVLRSFDKLPTELWFLIYVLSIGASALFVWIAMQTEYDYNGRTALSYISSMGELRTVLIGVLSSIIFGFVFMQLTLSFARRIKAHNLRSRIYVRKLYRRLTLWVKSKKSADRLMIYTAAYILIEIWLVAYIAMRCYRGAQGEVESVLLGEILFAVMWVVTIAAMHRISSDIKKLEEGVHRITEGDLDTKVEINSRTSIFRELARGVSHIGDGLKTAVETSIKDERMKTELITNVSHDLKTPLTSIINYINLLKREKMPTPEAAHCVEVLDSKAHRLQQLTEDLVEAAKATSGNIELNMMPLSFEELVKQALGEFEDKFAEKNLTVVASYPARKSGAHTASDKNAANTENREALEQSEAERISEGAAMVMADGRRLFRVLDNVLQNAYKYAMEGTRIYIDLVNENGRVSFTMKNISRAQLNINADELMERFTRGDSSRTTEGSGLGLSIAGDLTKLMNGDFSLELDGDLFKVMIVLPEYNMAEGSGGDRTKEGW